MAKVKKPEYPKTLFILRVNAGTDDEFFQVTTDLNELDISPGETLSLGVYRLQKTTKVTNNTFTEDNIEIE